MSSTQLESLEKSPLFPLIIKLAVPSIIGLCASAGYQMLNAYFIGRCGTESIAAVALSFPIVMILAAVGQCIGAGAASFTARSLGNKESAAANNYATVGLIAALFSSIIISILGSIYDSKMLQWLGADSATLPLAATYTHWMLVAYIGLVINVICGYTVRAEGNTRFSMMTQLIAFVLNALFDYIFIIIFNMGITGAGIATFLAQFAAVIPYVFHFGYRWGAINLIRPKFSLKIIREIVFVGMPSGVTLVIAIIAISVMNKLASKFGTPSVAGIGIAARLLMIAILPVSGLCIGSQAVLGYNIGARNGRRVISALKIMIACAMVYTFLYGTTIVLHSAKFASFFASDPVVIGIASYAIRVFHVGLPMFAIQGVTIVFLQAKGSAARALSLAFLRQGILLLPLMLILQHFYALHGIAAAQLIADVVAGCVAIYLLVEQVRKIKKTCVL